MSNEPTPSPAAPTPTPTSRRIDAIFPKAVMLAVNPDAASVNHAIVESLPTYPELIDDSTTPENWFCRVASTFSTRPHVLTDEPMAPLLRFIQSSVVEFATELGWDDTTTAPAIFESWLNVYHPGSFQEVHQHPLSQISGVYYVSAPPGSGELFFQSPEPSMFPADIARDTRFAAATMTYPPADGLLVLFQSDLRHGVRHNSTDQPRISLAFNVRQVPREPSP